MSAAHRVTHEPKRYVFQCLGCGMLASSGRSDALTCSGACRVRAHRRGAYKAAAKGAVFIMAGGTPERRAVALMQQGHALIQLCPEYMDDVMAGKIEFDEIQPEAYRRYIRLVFDAVAALRTDRGGDV